MYWLEAFSIEGTELICKLLYKHLIDGRFKCRSSQGKVLPGVSSIHGIPSDLPADQIPADFDASGTRLGALARSLGCNNYLIYIYEKTTKAVTTEPNDQTTKAVKYT